MLNEIPPSKLTETYNDEEAYRRYVESVNKENVQAKQRKTIAEIQRCLERVLPARPWCEPLRLLDVGAGTGDFLALARAQGFEIYGNEISTIAARLAREKHGIHLSLEPLEHDLRDGFFDVITMWSLIEHVQDPQLMLNHAARLLRPEGILFVYTPVWCLYDTIGLLLARAHWSRLLDRRISWAHLQLFSRRGLEQACMQAGFKVLYSKAVCEYNFAPSAYLIQLGMPGPLSERLGRILSWLINHRLFFKNNLRLFCQRNEMEDKCRSRNGLS